MKDDDDLLPIGVTWPRTAEARSRQLGQSLLNLGAALLSWAFSLEKKSK